MASADTAVMITIEAVTAADAEWAAERDAPFDEVWKEYSERNSLGRLPTADEIAWAVTLLLEPEADVMHGGVLHLDGGGLSGIA